MRPLLSTFLILVAVIGFASSPNKVVGRQACIRCHQPEQRMLPGTTHDNDKACESCHGPGEQHLKSGGNPESMFSFKRAGAEEVRGRCGQCHNNPVMAKHAAGDVSCANCHSIHHYVRRKYLLKPEDGLNTVGNNWLPKLLNLKQIPSL